MWLLHMDEDAVRKSCMHALPAYVLLTLASRQICRLVVIKHTSGQARVAAAMVQMFTYGKEECNVFLASEGLQERLTRLLMAAQSPCSRCCITKSYMPPCNGYCTKILTHNQVSHRATLDFTWVSFLPSRLRLGCLALPTYPLKYTRKPIFLARRQGTCIDKITGILLELVVRSIER